MGKIARVNLSYTASTATIVGVDLIDAPVPVSGFTPSPTSTGAWLAVLDKRGREVFYRPLPDPHAGGEALRKNGALRRMKPRRRTQFASVEVPWPGPGSRIVVHVRRSAKPARKIRGAKARAAKGRASEIARLPLVPEKAPAARTGARRGRGFWGAAKKFPVTLDSRWGHDNPKALNLVFMPEAFKHDEMGRFHQQVDTVIDLFEATAPFGELRRALKVSRIEIPSETNNVGNAAGRTYFKARFTMGGRVIEIDQAIATKLIASHFAGQSARGMVVVNTTTYGGSGGAVPVFSCETHWAAHIAIHELGHSHFNLADEYSDAGQSATADPVEPNVSADFQRDRLKWAHLVAPDTMLPTWELGDPVPAGKTIGAFQGGKYDPRRIWRPAFDCKMRNVQTPDFCAVCEEQIRRDLEARLGAH